MNHSYTVRLALGSIGAASSFVRKRPFIVNHLVTVRCNLACPFCYVSGPEQKDYNQEHYPKSSELTTDEVRGFYRQLVDEGFRLAVLVGGEPLLRDDLDRCLEVLEGKLWVTVFTNGHLLAERHELVRRASNLFVSLDAPDEQHDVLRARPGLFARALAGIEEVRRRHPRLPVTVNMTVTRDNVERVGDMLAFAKELSLPISFQPPSYDGQFALPDRPRALSSTKTPDPTPVADAFRRIRAAAKRGDQTIIGSTAFFEHVIDGRAAYRCHYPAYVLGPVFPNGDVQGCVDTKLIGNLRAAPVREIIDSPEFHYNAARGPRCPTGCRDWGIYDLSALRERTMRAADLRRYGVAFLKKRRDKGVLSLVGTTLDAATRWHERRDEARQDPPAA